MSFLTNLLETIPNYESFIEEKEPKLKTTKKANKNRLQLLVELAFSYAHVHLEKGLVLAEEGIRIAEALKDYSMKGNALCVKAMNQFRIGYFSKAEVTALQALSIFEEIADEKGKSDAYFLLGSMPYMNIGRGDTCGNLEKAFEKYATCDDKTGIYLVRIQQTMQLYLAEGYDKASKQIHSLLNELTEPHQCHLACFAYMQISVGMHIKQDLIQFTQNTLAWQKVALANGNFHDYCMTKAMLTDSYRFQYLDQYAMQACLDAMHNCEKLGSIHGHSTVAIVMANILSSQSQYEDAIVYFQKAMDAAREIEDDYKYLMALNAIGEIYMKLGKSHEAREAFQTAMQKAIIVKDRINLIAAHRHLAELAYSQGEFDQALFEFKLFFDNGNNSDGWNVQDYGNYAAAIAKASDAALLKVGIKPEERFTLRLQYLKKFIGLAEHQQNKREQVNAINALAEYYEETNDLLAAIQFRKKYILLYEELVDEQNTKNMARLRMEYESEKKEKELILLKKENEQALLNERLRISRDLHDDMGSTLGSISIYSEVAKNRMAKNENAEEAIAKIGNASRELIDKMSDIVWSINPENENLQHLVNRIQVYAAVMLPPHEIFYSIKTDEKLKKRKLEAEERKNIYLIYKEAVHNIIKYAACSKVEITLFLDNDEFIMTIKDNGKGFEMDTINLNKSLDNNGLKNMKTRSESINAAFSIHSIINAGTTIRLKLTI